MAVRQKPAGRARAQVRFRPYRACGPAKTGIEGVELGVVPGCEGPLLLLVGFFRTEGSQGDLVVEKPCEAATFGRERRCASSIVETVLLFAEEVAIRPWCAKEN